MNTSNATANRSRPGDGQLQWTVATWVGIVVATTAWMVGTSIMLLIHGQLGLASIPAVAFLVINGVVVIMWRQRDRVEPLHAYMVVLILFTIAVPAIFVPVSWYGSPAALQQLQWPPPLLWHVIIYLLGPMAILLTWSRMRKAHRASDGHLELDPTQAEHDA